MDEMKVQHPDSHQLVLSLAQDIVSVVSHGRVKTPKHVALPMTIKHMTGSGQP